MPTPAAPMITASRIVRLDPASTADQERFGGGRSDGGLVIARRVDVAPDGRLDGGMLEGTLDGTLDGTLEGTLDGALNDTLEGMLGSGADGGIVGGRDVLLGGPPEPIRLLGGGIVG